jgi:hypothetical protein
MWHVWGRNDFYTGFWMEKPVGLRTVNRPRHRWEDNMKH